MLKFRHMKIAFSLLFTITLGVCLAGVLLRFLLESRRASRRKGREGFLMLPAAAALL